MKPDTKQEKIVLIDGSGYFFRAYFAITRLSTSKGFPTNAIFGFINMILRVIEVEKPKKLAIVFDTATPTFRKERYQEYKANRERPPEDLVKQIPHILRSVDAFGIRRFEKPGFEADDVIATIAERAQKEGFKVEIITGDKDLMQLVNEHVTLYDTMKDKKTGIEGVKERFGVAPEQIVDLLALMGDSSDNIPGVSGIGEKTAAELIRTYGSLDGLYSRLSEIKQPKRRETLEKEKAEAYLSKELATVIRDVELDFKWDDFNYTGVTDQLGAFLEEFEFQGLMKRLDVKSKAESTFTPGKYMSVDTKAKLDELIQKIRAKGVVSLDTETTSLAIHSARLAGISLATDEAEGYYVPVGHHAPGEPENLLRDQLPAEVVREALKPVLEDPTVAKIGQNLKYDTQILRRWGINVDGVASDTMLASYLLDPDQPHGLDSLAFRVLGHQNITYEDVTGKGKNQITFSEVSVEKATQYSGEDADVTLRLHEKLLPEIEQKGLTRLFREIEVPLLEVLADMEYGGILVDQLKLQEMSEQLADDIDRTQKRIFELAGEPINVNSPKQLATLLFEKLKLPPVRKTKTGYSTDEAVLEELREQHEVCGWIIGFREFMKLKSTYVDGLLAQIHPETGRVHTSFNQTVAATGRLSSTNPNLQNIPSREGKYNIRAVFKAAENCSLLSADYSQIELRLLADMSGDEVLLEAFKNNEDIHQVTARSIFSTKTVTDDQRKVAKTINFGVVYGQTPYGLSQQLGISPGEAKHFIETYFNRYPRVRSFLDGLAVSAKEKGYAETLLGRRRYIADLDAKNPMMRQMAERAAINAPLQGTAADLIKIAMVRLHRALKDEGLSTRMVLQVHDELVLEVCEPEKKKVEDLVRKHMEGALVLKIPLSVNLGWGQNWGECQ